jgi:hypothetical protein
MLGRVEEDEKRDVWKIRGRPAEHRIGAAHVSEGHDLDTTTKLDKAPVSPVPRTSAEGSDD